MTSTAIDTLRLTEKQRLFVLNYVQTGNAEDAAIAAGYVGALATTVSRLVQTPSIAAAIQHELAFRLRTQGATLALAVLLEIAGNKLAPAGARVDASKTILDRAGIVAPRIGERADKPLTEHSVAELRTLVAELEHKAAAQARDVTPTPHTTPRSAEEEQELSDMMG